MWATKHPNDAVRLVVHFDEGKVRSYVEKNDMGDILYKRTFGEIEELVLNHGGKSLVYTRSESKRSLKIEGNGTVLYREIDLPNRLTRTIPNASILNRIMRSKRCLF